jgi:predicted adenylyl cyclase CyaB
LAQNLEAKFRLSDFAAAEAAAAALGYIDQGTLVQRDTFFVVPQGKLKLREEEGEGARLIGYARHQIDGLQVSDYRLVPMTDAEGTRAVLAATLGVLAEVRKRRRLWLHGTVRLHLDQVGGLGDFGEIEAVVSAGENAECYRAFVDQTLAALGVDRTALIDASYFELAARRR